MQALWLLMISDLIPGSDHGKKDAFWWDAGEGFVGPGDFFQVYKNTFDYLYKNEPTGMINLTVHAHFGGRPLISAVVAEALKYMKGFSGVWFARHDEMARWVIDRTERG